MSETFQTIARYEYSSEAHIVKGRLEAEGIEVFMADSYTIDTDPLVSNAIGGVKLKVLSENVVAAKQILNSISNSAVDQNGSLLSCPKCGEQSLELFSTITNLKSFFAFVFGFLFGTLPFYTRYKYLCNHCKKDFDFKEIKNL